ncbi:MAG: ATP-dependent DNA helicase RecG [Candidatus Promineifilaceae bacterium]
MTQAFQRLENILKLEAKQGYQDTAVVGGIRQFATFWVSQAREETANELDHFFIDQVGEMLSGYNRLPGREARKDTVNSIRSKLASRAARLAKSGRSASPAKKPPKPIRQRSQPQKKQAAPKQPAAASKQRSKQPERKKPQGGAKRATNRQAKSAAPAAPKPTLTNEQGLAQSVMVLKGVGPKVAELMSRVGAQTLRDLLFIHPRRYDDYSLMKPIGKLLFGETVTVIGTVEMVRARKTRNNSVAVHVVLGDGSGKVQLNFFNQQWLVNQLKSGMQIAVSGKVDQYLGRLIFSNPEWEALSKENLRTNRIVPVYPLTKGLSANKMRGIVKQVVDQWAASVPDPLPDTIRSQYQLMRLPDALRHIHFPRSQEMLQQARARLAFDELFLLQIGMLHQRQDWQKEPAIPLEAHEEERIRFFNTLPFEPTGAQHRVVREISDDLCKDVPMNRLLQGDVGAGKTLVAAAAMVVAVKSGTQVALMAPTEILAEQHYKGLKSLLEPLDISVRLLTGGVRSAEKAQIYADASSGEADIFIGTTALIQPDVQFKQLGLVVIDEQHRFGVDQRAALRDKGDQETSPHLLVMTATPIPRTLALSLYGDLDVSILDEMPPGRQVILTKWLRQSERERAYGFMQRQAEQGRQAYIIYPLVEDSDTLDAPAAVSEHKRLQAEIFPDLKIGLLHGKMKSAEKEAAMRAFYDNETQILVSTTVVEVGVDVPNSTVIMIEGANRFGLAQLHQLRGRVGRGEHKSYCVLVSDSNSAEATERLTALEDTNDGFQLAEKDLQLRGPGEFFGRRQSGLPELQLASLFDTETLEQAREAAQTIFKQDPELTQPQHNKLHKRVVQFWENAGDVS